MNQILITQETSKINLMTKIMLILFGVFFPSLIFSITVKIFQGIGILIGLITSSIIIFCAFYSSSRSTRLRIVAWSMLIYLILGIFAYFTGVGYLKNALEGF